MTEHIMSGLVITTGLIAAGVGVVTSSHRLRTARRAYRKAETITAAMPEGWASWFFDGFAGLTLGTGWLWATAILLGWTLAATSLIVLGLQLFWRT